MLQDSKPELARTLTSKNLAMSVYSLTEFTTRELSHRESFTVDARSQTGSISREPFAEGGPTNENRSKKKNKDCLPPPIRVDARGRTVLVRRYALENQPWYIEQRRREEAARARLPPVIDFDAEDAAAEREERQKRKKMNKKGLSSLFRKIFKNQKSAQEGTEEQNEAASQAESGPSQDAQN